MFMFILILSYDLMIFAALIAWAGCMHIPLTESFKPFDLCLTTSKEISLK